MDADYIDFTLIKFNAHADQLIDGIFENVPDDVDLIEEKFNAYFSHAYWNQINEAKENYLLTTITSVDNAVRVGWLPPTEIYSQTPNFKAQAIGYEALFRSLYNQNTKVDGVISYGYWWNDRLFPETKVSRNDVDCTIRSKDAESIFYKWAEIFK